MSYHYICTNFFRLAPEKGINMTLREGNSPPEPIDNMSSDDELALVLGLWPTPQPTESETPTQETTTPAE
jgi:hypothetical protein